MSALLDCGHEESPHEPITRGYGTDAKGRKHCYDCCERQDREQMAREGRIDAYLNTDGTAITNWPGRTLARVVREWQTSAGGFLSGHNITRVWAQASDGSWWSGRGPGRGMYLRVTRLKREPR